MKPLINFEPIIYQASLVKDLPSLFAATIILVFVSYFFAHLADQGQTWAWVVVALPVFLFLKMISASLISKNTLTLSNSGIVYQKGKGKVFRVPWSQIAEIAPY